MADTDITVRAIEPEDVDRIEDITVEAWAPAYEAYRENMGAALFEATYGDDWRAYKAAQVREQCLEHPKRVRVADRDGTAVGYVTFSVDRETDTGEIGNNAVDPAWHGRGIAATLYRHVLEEFRDRGLSFATVSTGLSEAYAPARRAYEKVGFDIERRTVTYWQEL